MQDVDNLGSKGAVADVRPGYARNLLIPRKWAVYATPQNLTKHSEIIEAAKVSEAAPVEPADASASVATAAQ